MGSVAGVVTPVEGEIQLSQDALRVGQLDAVGRAPCDDRGFAAGSVVVADQIELPCQEAAAKLLQKSRNCGQRLRSRKR